MMVVPGTPAILMGTTAIEPLGSPYYGRLQKSCNGVCIPLPRAGLGSLVAAADQLEGILEALRGDDGILRIVGHSQGGNIAVLHASKHPNTLVLTIGAPHFGAQSCQLMNLLPKQIRKIVPAFRDMRPGSRFMEAYAELLPNVAPSLISLATTHDKVVNHRSSYVSGARNVLVTASPHEQLRYLRYYGSDVEVIVAPHVGHINAVMKDECRGFVRDFVGVERLRLVTA